MSSNPFFSIKSMAKGASSKCFFFFFFFFVFCLLFVLFFCNSLKSSSIPKAKDAPDFEKIGLETEKKHIFPSFHRALIDHFRYKTTEFDSIDPPTTAIPDNSVPVIVTVPGTYPVGISSPTPTTTTPVTNPVTTPTTTNPVTSYPPPAGGGTNPALPPPVAADGGSAPASGGARWCIAKNGASQAALQAALDYACGIGGADCSTIQQGASCYNPVTLQDHASHAFNSYYQKNPVPTSCDFGGVAVLTNVDPSTGSCVYPSSSSPSSTSSTLPAPTTGVTPTTQGPVNPTPLPTPTTSSSGPSLPWNVSPPPGFGFGNPGQGTPLGFDASPPIIDTSTSASNDMPSFVNSLLVLKFITIGRLIFGL